MRPQKPCTFLLMRHVLHALYSLFHQLVVPFKHQMCCMQFKWQVFTTTAPFLACPLPALGWSPPPSTIPFSFTRCQQTVNLQHIVAQCRLPIALQIFRTIDLIKGSLQHDMRPKDTSTTSIFGLCILQHKRYSTPLVHNWLSLRLCSKGSQSLYLR